MTTGRHVTRERVWTRTPVVLSQSGTINQDPRSSRNSDRVDAVTNSWSRREDTPHTAAGAPCCMPPPVGLIGHVLNSGLNQRTRWTQMLRLLDAEAAGEAHAGLLREAQGP